MRKHFTNGLMLAGIVLFSAPCSAEWWITTVDSNAFVCGRAAIDLDSLDRPCVLYDCESKSGPVRYATWNSDSTWTIEIVTSSTRGGLGLELDSRDNPHAVWKWWYSSRDSTGWHPLKYTGADGYTRSYPSLALDSRDRPHVGVFHRSATTFDTAFFHYYLDIDSTEWLCDTLEYGRYGMYDTTLVFWDYGISMAIDDSDCVHAVYAAGADFKLLYAKKTNGQWHKEWVDTVSEGLGAYPSMVLDSSGLPCIAYFYRDGSIFQMRFAKKIDEQWEVTIADSMRGGNRTSLAMGPDDLPRMCYTKNEEIWYVWFDGVDWHTTLIEEGQIGYSSDLKVDTDGYAHITYVYDPEKAVRYVKGRGYHVGAEEKDRRVQVARCKLQVYPNPFIHNTVVEFRVRGQEFVGRFADRNLLLQIYDVMGRLVEESQSEVVGTTLPPGIYFVKARGNVSTKITKIGRVR